MLSLSTGLWVTPAGQGQLALLGVIEQALRNGIASTLCSLLNVLAYVWGHQQHKCAAVDSIVWAMKQWECSAGAQVSSLAKVPQSMCILEETQQG